MERIVKRENLEGSYVVEVWLLKMWAEGNKRGAYDDSYLSFWISGQLPRNIKRKRKLQGKIINSICDTLSLRFQWDSLSG